MDETLADVPITIIDCNEEFVNDQNRHKEMMSTVSGLFIIDVKHAFQMFAIFTSQYSCMT